MKWGRAKHLTLELTGKSATGKVERRWLSLFVATMGALAIFASRRANNRGWHSRPYSFSQPTRLPLQLFSSCTVSRL